MHPAGSIIAGAGFVLMAITCFVGARRDEGSPFRKLADGFGGNLSLLMALLIWVQAGFIPGWRAYVVPLFFGMVLLTGLAMTFKAVDWWLVRKDRRAAVVAAQGMGQATAVVTVAPAATVQAPAEQAVQTLRQGRN